jgi:phosphoglycolate phosphatase
VNEFSLYVFDLDGTLVDSRRDLADSANELLRQCGAAPRAEEEIGRMVGDGAAVLVARVFAAAAIPQPPDALARYLAIYDERLLTHTRVYPGMIDVLDTLRTRAPLAILTNKPLASTRRVLAGLGLEPYFPAASVIGGDGPFARKPDAGGLRHLAEQADAPIASTLLVGDSMIDFRTARSAGARICLARYGFGFETIPVSERGAADRVIDSPNALLSV